MYYFESLKQQLADEINILLDKKVVGPSDFVIPPDPKLGDVSLPLFTAAKELSKNPVELAKNLSDQLKHEFIASVMLAGPYLNISLSSVVQEKILKEIAAHSEDYGNNSWGDKKRVMLEYANGNTHKEVHVGHLRNIAFGDAVNRILAANGFTAIPVGYINDFGIHTAKTLWHYLKTKAVEPETNKGFFLGQLYAAATKELGDDATKKSEVGDVMKAIESRSGEVYELWQKTRQWSLDQWAEVNKELGVKFETTFYESDFIEEGLKIVEDLKAKKILVESQGAVIANLEEDKLGVLVVIRSDGTALYPVADFALTFHKVEKYKLDTSLWVVDIRQGQYFHQLFKVLEQAGLKAHLEHLPYDFVKLPSGMMSSRSGNIIKYEDLKNETLQKVVVETKKRHDDWSEEKINEVARVLAFGALKFEMVKVAGDKIITFDMETALRFEGFTAAYIQYTYARIQSIVRKATRLETVEPDYMALIEPRERQLTIALARFPEVLRKAGENYQPSEIARYLFETTQLLNDYYHGVPILNDETLKPEIAKARLELIQAVALVINRGLDLLGIETVEEM